MDGITAAAATHTSVASGHPQQDVEADEALLKSLFPDGQHVERLRAAGHVGRLRYAREVELEQAGLPELDRRAVLVVVREENATTANPLLARP